MKAKTNIEVKGVDIKRPSDRPAKTNWKIELIKKGLSVLQHAAPVSYTHLTLPTTPYV